MKPESYWKIALIVLGISFVSSMISLAASIFTGFILVTALPALVIFVIELVALLLFARKNRIGFYLNLVLGLLGMLIGGLTLVALFLPQMQLNEPGTYLLFVLMGLFDFILGVFLIFFTWKSKKALFKK